MLPLKRFVRKGIWESLENTEDLLNRKSNEHNEEMEAGLNHTEMVNKI